MTLIVHPTTNNSALSSTLSSTTNDDDGTGIHRPAEVTTGRCRPCRHASCEQSCQDISILGMTTLNHHHQWYRRNSHVNNDIFTTFTSLSDLGSFGNLDIAKDTTDTDNQYHHRKTKSLVDDSSMMMGSSASFSDFEGHEMGGYFSYLRSSGGMSNRILAGTNHDDKESTDETTSNEEGAATGSPTKDDCEKATRRRTRFSSLSSSGRLRNLPMCTGEGAHNL